MMIGDMVNLNGIKVGGKEPSYFLNLRDKRTNDNDDEPKFINLWLKPSAKSIEGSPLESAYKHIKEHMGSRADLMTSLMNGGWKPINCSINTTPRYNSVLIFVSTEEEKVTSVVVSRVEPTLLYSSGHKDKDAVDLLDNLRNFI